MIRKFSHSVNIFIISEAEVIKEKVKPAPVKKGTVRVKSFLHGVILSCVKNEFIMILRSLNIIAISEAEIIKEKVKPAPEKKGMNIL